MTSSQQAPEMSVGARSETGKVREENQDRMTRTQVPLGDLYVVADGMGGYQGGALAAQITVQTVEDYLRHVPPEASPEESIKRAIEAANTRVHAEAHSGSPLTERMGSTIVLLLVNRNQAYVAHVGDSRAYLIRQGQIKLLTRDHTAVQRMLDAHIITEEEAEDHPDSSLLSRAIGPSPAVDPEILKPIPLEIGDAILLCSDGLSRYAKDSQILEIVTGQGSEQEIAKRLVDLAMDSGGQDNITVQFARFAVRRRSRAFWWSAVAVTRGIVIGVVGFAAGAYSAGRLNTTNIYPAGESTAASAPVSGTPAASVVSVEPAKTEEISTQTTPAVDAGLIKDLQNRIATLQRELEQEKKQTARLKQQLSAKKEPALPAQNPTPEAAPASSPATQAPPAEPPLNEDFKPKQ